MNVYNSMKRGGHDDATIQGQLQTLGYYDPNAAPPDSTPNVPVASPRNIINRGDDINRIADKTSLYDYRNPGKSAYGPKGQLEINPSAFGMSFPEQPGSNKEGIAGFIDSFTSLPTRSLSSFTSPTTGGNITGPAEQGFMSQVLSNDPAGRTREELMNSYDNYNKFIGRSSQFADARQKGPGGNIMGSIFSAASGIPFLGSLANFGGKGKNTSDRRRYAVDNAGFGQGTGRDEFGVFTGGKTLFGKTGDYGERMTNKIDDIESFFSGASGKLGDKSLTGIDFNNLTEADIENMKRINGTLTKQYFAYKNNRLPIDILNKKTKQTATDKKAAAAEAQAAIDLQNARKEAINNPKSLYSGGSNYRSTDSGGNAVSFNSAPGTTTFDSKSGRGRRDYSKGGLATMFKRKI
jgi:hypothetical protein